MSERYLRKVDQWIEFRVVGIPRPQGSKKAFKLPNGGVAMVEASKYVKTWRQDIRAEASAAMLAQTGDVMDGPVGVRLAFIFQRPKAHYGAGRNSKVLKPGAPRFPITTRVGDLDKLVRAALDAMTGIVYVDDCQVAELSCSKEYLHPSSTRGLGVVCTVEEI